MSYLRFPGLLLTTSFGFSLALMTPTGATSAFVKDSVPMVLKSGYISNADVPAYPDQPGPDAIRPEFENPDVSPAPASAQPRVGKPTSRRPALSWPLMNRPTSNQKTTGQPDLMQDTPGQMGAGRSSDPDAGMCPLTGEWEYSSASDFGYSPEEGFFGGGPAYSAPVTITQNNGSLTMSGFYRISTGSGQGQRFPQTTVTLPLQFGTGQLTANILEGGNKLEGEIVFSDGKSGRSSTTIPFTMKRKTPLPSHLVCGGW
jgi:hypothetical protein